MTATREIGDLAALAVACGSLFEFLPAVAAGLSILWYLFRFAAWVGKRWTFLQ